MTDSTRTVSPTKWKAPWERQLLGGFSFLVKPMESSHNPIFSICSSPQKSSAVQKVYRRPLRLLRRHLSQRERPWQAGPHFLLDAESPTGRKSAGLATEGSSFWTSAPCQAVAGLDSGALPFPRHRALLVQTKADRHAKGSPFGGAGAERLRGQGRCQTALTQR